MARSVTADNFAVALASAHAAASGVFVLETGKGAVLAAKVAAAGFPPISAGTPLRFTVVERAANGVIGPTTKFAEYLATGLSGDTLSGCAAAAGTADQAFDADDVLAVYWTAGFVAELQAASAGTGTVTAVSVATANGFGGTSDGDPDAPALTVNCAVTGLLKGDGTAVSAATADTDYATPAGVVIYVTARGFAPLASPTFTGVPAAPTASPGANTTQLATTAFVTSAVAAAGGGTVTSASVASANGFAGTVANASTTPAITLSTTITGIVKGNGTAISAAAAGTDYLAPSGDGSALTGITESQVGGLVADLALKAPLASPTFTGVPAAPTAAGGTSTTQLATTAFVAAAVAGAGTVTAVSVSSTNGFAGIVTNPTTTPAIALSTTITGLLKGTGTALAAASAGDVPDLSATYSVKAGNTSLVTVGTVVTGTWNAIKIGLAYGGTNADLSGTGGAKNYLKQASTGAAVTVGAIPAADLPTTGLAIDAHTGLITSDSDGATVTFDLSVSDWHSVTLGGNRTLALANVGTNQQFTVVLVQDGTGSRTVTWWGGITWFTGTFAAPTLPAGAGKAIVCTFKQAGAGAYYGFVAGASGS